LVDGALVGRILTHNRGGEFLPNMARGLLDAFPAVTLLIAVTQFGGFLFSCRSSRRNGGHAYRATIEPNLGLNGGVATRIENLTAYNAYDLGHL
jgi:hypothetical protein